MRQVFGILLLAASCPVFASSAESVKPAATPAAKVAPSDYESIELGCHLYKHHCASCHGTTGKGNGAAAYSLPDKPSNLTDPDYWKDSDDDLLDVITDGRGAMPKYKRMLTEKQRLQVIAFMRTLAPKPEPKADSKAEAKVEAKPETAAAGK